MKFDWPEVLNHIADHEDLTSDQTYGAMAEVLAGNATDAQLAGLIVGLRVKGETPAEMLGLAQGMLDAAEPLNLPPGTIDIVGTGGSAHRRRHALNVSTMASFVAAAAGATVCKHGNYRASSTSGAFDFLEALGVRINITSAELEKCVAETGIGFAFARTFHPAMRHAGPVRAELGIPTVFNVLGPLAHPGRLKHQLIGTSKPELAPLMAQVLHKMGSELAWVVCGADGLDELSTTGVNTVHVVTPAGVSQIEVSPTEVGLAAASGLDVLAGGDSAQNALVFEAMMSGEQSPARDIVVLNAGAALVVAGVAGDLGQGVEACSQALVSGAVGDKLKQLKSSTNS